MVERINTLNNLTGEQWLYATRTIYHKHFDHEIGQELRREHGANKPPSMMKEWIEVFTRPGELVLDPFMGVGGTLLGAALAGRRAIGIELASRWIDIYTTVAKQHALSVFPHILADCREALPSISNQSIDFILTDPPYGVTLPKTMSKKGSSRQNRKTDFAMESLHPKDVANLETMPRFYDAMAQVFQECYRVLKPGRYMLFMTRNNYIQKEYCFADAALSARAQTVGFLTKSTIVWIQDGLRLRPYGYPYQYIPNIIDTRIVVLQKPGKRESILLKEVA